MPVLTPVPAAAANPARPARAWRRGLVNLLLLLAGALVALGTGEVIVRAFLPEYYVFGENAFVADPLLGWRHQPESRAVIGRFGDYRFELVINARGLRDREYEVVKPPGRKRIIVIGDSFVEGFGVTQEAVFTERLEARAPGAEVINAGVAGYETGQEYLWLTRDGLAWQPDAVVVCLYPENDIVELADPDRLPGFPKGRFRLAGDSLTFDPPRTAAPPPTETAPARLVLPLPGKRWLEEHSFSYHFYRFGYARLLAALGLRPRGTLPEARNSIQLYERTPAPIIAENILLFQRLLGEIAAVGRAHRLPVIFVRIPSKLETDPAAWQRLQHQLGFDPAAYDLETASRLLAGFSAATGTVIEDPLPEFRAATADGERLYFLHDGHLNATGHRVLADWLATRLRDRGVFP